MQQLTKEQLQNTNLSNVQIELLTLFQTQVDYETLQDIRKLLKNYFARKAIAEADNVWAKKKLTNDDMDKLLAGEG